MKKRDEIIWNNVLFLAGQKGWNKTELAKKVGTNTSVLNNIKDGVPGKGGLIQPDRPASGSGQNLHGGRIIIFPIERRKVDRRIEREQISNQYFNK